MNWTTLLFQTNINLLKQTLTLHHISARSAKVIFLNFTIFASGFPSHSRIFRIGDLLSTSKPGKLAIIILIDIGIDFSNPKIIIDRS